MSLKGWKIKFLNECLLWFLGPLLLFSSCNKIEFQVDPPSSNTSSPLPDLFSTTIERATTETVGVCDFTAPNEPVDAFGFSYKIRFSTPIDENSFTVSDLTNSGTGGSTSLSWSLESCGDAQTFKLTVDSVEGFGTIAPSLLQDSVQALDGRTSLVLNSNDEINYVFTGWYQEAYIKTSNSLPWTYLESLSIHNDLLAIGSPREESNQNIITNGPTASYDTSAPESGAVFLYRRKGLNWEQEAYIKASNSQDYNHFGNSVALYEDTLAVSAPDESGNQTEITNGPTSPSDNSLYGSGAVYVYRKTGDDWEQEAYIKASNAEEYDSFGKSLSLYDNTLAVGTGWESSDQTIITNGEDTPVSNDLQFSGAVYIYKRTGEIWNQEAFVKASNADEDDEFSKSISISEDTLAVTSIKESSNQTTISNGETSSNNNDLYESGAVYIYKRTGVTWKQEAYIKASNADEYDNFGTRVSLSGNILAVSAIYESSSQTSITNGTTSDLDNSKPESGAVYVYRRTGTSWEQEAYIKSSNADEYDQFGFSLSLEGNFLAVGAIGESSNQIEITNGPNSSEDNSANFSGAVYLYQYKNLQWVQDAYIKAPNAEPNDGFGFAVSLHGDTLAVAAPGESSNLRSIINGDTASDDNSAEMSGAVYVFRKNGMAKDITTINSSFDLTSVHLQWTPLPVSSQYFVSYQSGTVAPSDCNQGNILNVGSNGQADISGLITDQPYSFRVCAHNGTSLTAGAVITVTPSDPTPPDVSINQGTLETVGTCSFTNVTDPAMVPGFSYRIHFSRPINEDTFTESDIINNGTTGALVSWTLESCGDDRNFKLTATSVHASGTVRPVLNAGRVQKPNGISNTLSTGFDNEVTYIVLGWGQEAYIKHHDAEISLNGSPAISGDTLAVASSNEEVIVYRRSGITWEREAVITAPNAENQDSFGEVIAISGDLLAIGAPEEDSNATNISYVASSDNSFTNSGAVYIYTRNTEDEWEFETYIKPLHNRTYLNFGKAIALSGNFLAVGIPGEGSSQTTITNGTTAPSDDTNYASGATYVYIRSPESGDWEMSAFVKASNNDELDNFGNQVALSGKTLVVSTTREKSNQITITNGETSSPNNSLSNAGAAYVYVHNEMEGWKQEAYIKSGNNESYDYFGTTISVDGDTIAVGAPGEDSIENTITNGDTVAVDNTAWSSGAVYVYKRNGGAWAQEAYIKPSNNQVSEWGMEFGNSVSLNGNFLAVGAPGEASIQNFITNGSVASLDQSSLGSGAVYIYRRNGHEWEQSAYIKASNNDGLPIAGGDYRGDNFGSEVYFRGDTLAVYAPGEGNGYTGIINGPTSSTDNSNLFSGAVFVYRNNQYLFDVREIFPEPSEQEITLKWYKTGGIATSYIVSFLPGETPPSDCLSGTNVGDTDTYIQTGLESDEFYSFRICATDGTDVTPGGVITVKTFTP